MVRDARPRAHFSHRRLLVVLATIAYVAAFHATYRDLISPIFDFFGLGFTPLPERMFWATAVLCVIPSLWMPIEYTRPSQVLFLMQYFLIFIPASFIVFYSIRPVLPQAQAFQLVCAMFAGLSVMQLCYLLPVVPVRVAGLTPAAFWTVVAVGTITFIGYLSIVLASNFRIANFTEIYDIRAAMGLIIGGTGSRFGQYAQVLLERVFLPLIFVVGVKRRQWPMPVIAVLGFVFLFGIGGAKTAILALAYLPLLYLLLTRPPARVPVLFATGLTGALLSGYATHALFPRLWHISYLAVVHFRLFTVPALTIPQYADFFASHAVTHLSGVTGFSWFIPYPYESDIPYTIGRYYYHASIGANSGFWASDGIAAFGVWGILPVSAFCALVFWVFDCATAAIRPAVTGTIIAMCAVSFTNVSLFTTLITGGIALVTLMLAVAPLDDRGDIDLPTLAIPRRVPLAEQS